MPPWASLASLATAAPRLDPNAWIDASAVWAVTLWTAGRAPLLVGLNGDGLGLSRLGLVARQQWEDLSRRFPTIVHHDFAILPDRMRALIHIARSHRVRTVTRVVRWFKGSVERSARGGRVPRPAPVWDSEFHLQLVSSVEELGLWRRRIRAGLAGALAPMDIAS